MGEKENSLVVFQGENVRRTWFNEEWWFSVADIIQVLTESSDPKQYIKKIRSRDSELNSYWGTICTPLELVAPDGKKRKSNCVSLKGAFRLIQSIPSKKAEPFKRWLAKVGYERVQEINNPELAQKRMKEIYKAKGNYDDWIEKRVRGIIIRDELTDEWDKRGLKSQKEYAILTAEISKATFGLTPNEYKEFKGLKRENLRDHMDDLELIFSMLGEASTTKIARNKDAQGFFENKDAAKRGGEVAGIARTRLEEETGGKVVSKDNYLHLDEKKKRKLKHNKE
jgi:DNA-damage-inducible protein D